MLTPAQIRAARAMLNLDQKVVAEAIGVTSTNISEIESEKTKSPKASTVSALQTYFELKGLAFTDDGGVKPFKHIIQVYEGTDCYVRFLEDAARSLRKGDEFLKIAAHEGRSSEQVVLLSNGIREKGVRMRALIRNGDTHIMGNLHEYRWMPDALFAGGDVKVILPNKVAWLASWENVAKIIVIEDAFIAEEARRHFNFVWDHSIEPTHSTSERRFDDVAG